MLQLGVGGQVVDTRAGPGHGPIRGGRNPLMTARTGAKKPRLAGLGAWGGGVGGGLLATQLGQRVLQRLDTRCQALNRCAILLLMTSTSSMLATESLAAFISRFESAFGISSTSE